jgi:uncharacterized protein (DUF4213/DUF364 family)
MEINKLNKFINASKSWDDLVNRLGTGTIAPALIKFRDFKKARRYAQSLKLKSFSEWIKFTKSNNFPNDIPANPRQTYKNKGWVSVGDWLGY